MKIKTLRIQAQLPDMQYTIFDRHGNFEQKRVKAIEILNPPKVLRFGFCPIDTVDVTLEFETPLDSKQIRATE
jgi:hypothetical protein